MKLLSIDIETTGLDPKTCSILEFGAVVFDPQPNILSGTESERRWQTFECLIKHSRIQGEPYALGMNSSIIREISGQAATHRNILDATTFTRDLCEFLDANIEPGNKYTVVGKNYDAFDRQFLERVPGWNERVKRRIERRTLDVGSLCFCPDDGAVASLDDCLTKLGVQGVVTHRALDDALGVATAVSRFFAE